MENGRSAVVTSCGRRVVTGRFLVPASRPIARVTLRVDPVPGWGDAAWLSLTAAEAMRLAEALIAQARAVAGDR